MIITSLLGVVVFLTFGWHPATRDRQVVRVDRRQVSATIDISISGDRSVTGCITRRRFQSPLKTNQPPPPQSSWRTHDTITFDPDRRRCIPLASVVAACGDDDDNAADTTSAPATTAAAPATTAAAPATTAAATTPATTAAETPPTTASTSETTAPAGGEVDLSADCPSTLVIQTDWFAESEHGGLYEMMGDDYTVDKDNMRVKGTLMAGGQDTGIDLEIRMGGPAIGFEAPRAQIYTDDSINIAYSNIDAQMLAWGATPLVAIMAPLEINPQIIMWDPDTYPDIKTIADLGTNNVTINIFPGYGFADVFEAQGIWSKDQVDPSYDGSPARFTQALDIAQQGFASAEPYTYEFEIPEYGKKVAYQLLNDAGYPTYSQTLSVLPGERRCDGRLLAEVHPDRPAGAGRLRQRPGPGERDHRRRREAGRLVLGLHRRARRLLGTDAAGSRPGRQRPRRHARQLRPGHVSRACSTSCATPAPTCRAT